MSTVDIRFDPATQVTAGRLVAEIDATTSELARVLDPQAWCSSRYFERSYKVERVRNRYRPDPAPPALGSGWKGLLYEDFRWKVGPFEMSSLLNILNIDFRVRKGKLNLAYSLHRSLGGSTWFLPDRLGVDLDAGYVRAVEGGRTTRLEIYKELRFVEFDKASGSVLGSGVLSELVNLCVPTALEVWLRDMSAWSLVVGRHPSSDRYARRATRPSAR